LTFHLYFDLSYSCDWKALFEFGTKRKHIACISLGMDYSVMTAYNNWS